MPAAPSARNAWRRTAGRALARKIRPNSPPWLVIAAPSVRIGSANSSAPNFSSIDLACAWRVNPPYRSILLA